MKAARCILTFITLCLTFVAAIYCVVTCWDTICEFFEQLRNTLREKRESCPFCASEYDDYEDWE